MRPPRSPRSRAALLAAAVALSPSTTWARDTAGPDPRPRPAPRAQRAATPSAAPAPPPSVAPAPSAAPAPSDSAPPTEATPTADTPPSPDDAERAKRLYASGAEAFAAQRNADAIGYFRRAAQLVPSPKLTYNIGLAYEEMGDAARALAEYRTYLEQEEEHDPARRDEVKARIAHLEQRLAETGVQQLRVKSAPDGATVRIAGRTLGLTPWTGELTPGEHVVELSLPGHVSQRARVLVPPDRSALLELALPAAPPPAENAPSRWANVSPLTWTFLGVGAAALTGGVAFELSRASSSDAARDAADPTARAEARGAADAKQMASILLLGFGAGLTIGGSVLLALDLSEDPHDQTALHVPCGPAFCGFVTQGRF